MKKTVKTSINKVANKDNKKKDVRPSSKKRRIPFYTIILAIWLIALTVASTVVYKKFNGFMVHYEECYQASLPHLVMDDVFSHFENYDIDYIWDNMEEHPVISQFENEDTVKAYMLNMFEGKELTYRKANNYSDAMPVYTIEADGFLIANVTLLKDLECEQREFGFPTWVLKNIEFYTEPFESVTVTAPEYSTVLINGVALDDYYVCSDLTYPNDTSYVEPYGAMQGIHSYYVAELYAEPEVVVMDPFGNVQPLEYNEETDIYSTSYTTEHAEKTELLDWATEYTYTFINVISKDDVLSSLYPYMPEDSQLLDAISRNTALRYFASHGAVTFENTEVREFTVYAEDVVYIEIYTEQNIDFWSSIEVVPTTARLYCVKIDGEWQIASMRF